MSVPIKVNFDALTGLGARLDAIGASFASLRVNPSADAAALGDAKLATEFDRFCQSWNQGRQQITHELSTVTQVVRFAVDQYGQAEKDIIGGTGGSGSVVEGSK
jgi:hypothetical protein